MITRIKRIAQFLFDNADLIEQFLCQSDNYRSMDINLRVHKQNSPELEIELELYDETSSLQGLENNAIFRKAFIQLCDRINLGSGVTKLPNPVEVRDELEPKNQEVEENKNGD